MIIYAKYNDDKGSGRLASYSSEEYIDDAIDLAESVEILVNFAELKNYKSKYEEIYATLFKTYAEKESVPVNYSFEDILFTLSVPINGKKDLFRFHSFNSLDKVMEFIEEDIFDNEESCQILVNISEIKDYKEKYDEFYNLMIEHFKDSKNGKSF